MKKDIPALTGLRFVAAFAIVLDHLWPVIFKFDRLATLNNAVHQLAYAGMTLFFVLSGFIIHHNYAATVSSPGGLRQFFAARFSRLYPLYAVVLLLDIWLLHPAVDWKLLRMLTMTQSWSYEFVGGHFLPLGYRYSVVAWSISTEVFFYVVYPAVAAALRRIPAVSAAVVCAPMCAALLWWCNTHPAAGGSADFPLRDWLTYLSPYTRVLEFVTGCTIANLTRAPRSFPSRTVALLSAGYVGMFLCRGFIGVEWFSVGMLNVGLLLPIALLIFTVARYDTAPWLRRPFAVTMGNASYSMYLLHLIVVEQLAFSAPLADTSGNWTNAWTRFIVALLVIGAGSLLSHRYFEEPARKWLRNRLSFTARVGTVGSHSPSRYSS